MSFKIVSLLGSPRARSNSTALAGAFCEAAETLGAEVTEYRLAHLSYSGCQYLTACKTGGETCGLNDDASAVLDDIAAADIVVMSSPIWFTDVSSHLKKLIDRMFSFLTPDYATAEKKSRLAPGKQLVFIQVQGEAAPAYEDTLKRYDRGFHTLGFVATHHLYAAGIREPADLTARPELREQAADLARSLVPARST